MTTSGSIDFLVNRDQIIFGALRKCGVLGTGDRGSSTEEVADAAEALNIMIKAWQADGLQLWTRERAVLFLSKTKSAYTFPTDHACKESDYVKTEIRVAGSASDTTIEVDSTTGMVASDNIGIELDDGTIHWTTVSSVTDSDTVVIASGLASAASVDNHVYAYTTKLNMPLTVSDLYVRDQSDIDIPIIPMSRNEYAELSSKTENGQVIQAYYDRQRDTGVLYVWPMTDTVKSTVRFTSQRQIEDFDSNNDTPDFPNYWQQALVWGLAAEIAPEHGVDNPTWNMFIQKAAVEKANALSYDNEDTSVFFELEER